MSNSVDPYSVNEKSIETTHHNCPAKHRTIDDFLQEAYDATSTSSSQFRLKYWLAFLALGIANSGDATEVGCLNYVLSYPEFQMDILEGGDLAHRGALLTSSVYAGMLLGGLITGAVWGDQGHFGRKPTCLAGLALNATSGLASAFTPNVYFMSLSRFIGGLGIGAILSSLIAFATEISPPKQRGFFVTFVASFWTLGSITVAILAWLLLGQREASWRLFILSCALPALFGFISVAFLVPESPRFLALHGKHYQALFHANHYAIIGMGYQGPPLTLEELQFHYPQPNQKDFQTDKESVANKPIRPTLSVAVKNVRDLYATKEIRRTHTIPLQCLWFCMSFGSGLCTWMNTIFTQVGISDVYGSALLFAFANIPGNIASAILLDRVGRKTLLVWTMTLSSASLWLFAYGAHAANSNQDSPDRHIYTTMVVTSACIFHAFLVSGWCCISCMTGESFPTKIRSTGMGLCAASGRIAAMLVQFVNGSLIDTPAILLSLSSAMILIGALTPWCLKMPDLSHTPLQDHVTLDSGSSQDPQLHSNYPQQTVDSKTHSSLVKRAPVIAGVDAGEIL